MRFQREYIKSNPRSDTAVGLFRIPPKMYFLVIHHLFNRLSKELLNMIVFHGLRLFKNDTAWADRCFSICCWYISELCDNSFMLQKLYQWKKLHSYDRSLCRLDFYPLWFERHSGLVSESCLQKVFKSLVFDQYDGPSILKLHTIVHSINTFL